VGAEGVALAVGATGVGEGMEVGVDVGVGEGVAVGAEGAARVSAAGVVIGSVGDAAVGAWVLQPVRTSNPSMQNRNALCMVTPCDQMTLYIIIGLFWIGQQRKNPSL